MITRRRVVSGLAGSFIFFAGMSAFAQGPTSGRIEGTVRDQNDALVPDAEVRILSKTSGIERILKTDEAGHYVAALLPPGLYRVTVAAPRFAPMVLDA